MAVAEGDGGVAVQPGDAAGIAPEVAVDELRRPARAGRRDDARVRLAGECRELAVRDLDADGLDGVNLDADMAAVRADAQKTGRCTRPPGCG